MTTTEQTQSITIESMQIGHRYVQTIDPRYNEGWKVESIKHFESGAVVVSYNNGIQIKARHGEQVVIDCDEA